MAEHPIQGLMKTAMESIREMVDVNTIVGDPVESQDGSIIMPISRLSFGFAAGGAEYGVAKKSHDRTSQGGQADRAGQGSQSAGDGASGGLPFGGGSGAGVSIKPVGFLVVGQGQVRLLTVDRRAFYDRLVDLAPQLLQEVQSLIHGDGQAAGNRRAGAARIRGGAVGETAGVATEDVSTIGRRVRTRPEA